MISLSSFPPAHARHTSCCTYSRAFYVASKDKLCCYLSLYSFCTNQTMTHCISHTRQYAPKDNHKTFSLSYQQGDWWWHNRRNRSLVHSGRPNLVQLVGCTGIEVTGVTLRDSPFWCLHPVMSRDVHIHHMKIRARMYAPNSDGECIDQWMGFVFMIG